MNRKFFRVASLAALVCLGAEAHGPASPYMGGPAEVVAAPNGALINKNVLPGLSAWAMTMPAEPIKVADGVWQLVGRGINSPVVIEGDDGLIVWDTGESPEEGRKLLADISQGLRQAGEGHHLLAFALHERRQCDCRWCRRDGDRPSERQCESAARRRRLVLR
jgi:hypothetical protein